VKVCHDCGATAADADFPARYRGDRGPIRCVACAAAPYEPCRPRPVTPPIRTRASYRAAHRHRGAQAQLDLVDLLVRPP
jgi:hypothetical protein